MAKTNFITLHERKTNVEILLNTDSIVSVKDLRTDKTLKSSKDWQWSVVTTTKSTYDVVETIQQIIEKI